MKHKGMKILAMLLTLAMLVGLMPGMGLTVNAAALSKLTLNVGENGKVVMNNGIFGNATSDENIFKINSPWNVSSGSILRIDDGKSANMVEDGSVNIQPGGKFSFYPGSDNTGTITATPEDGYVFAGWYNGETLYSNNAELEYKNISEDLDLTAQFHTHSFTYSVNGATITATCNADGCTLDDGTEQHKRAVTLTIVKPTLTTYGQTGEGISASATLTGLTDFNTANGLDVQASSIIYWNAKIREGVYKTDGDRPLSAAPTSAGNYLAKITVNNCIAAVGYTINKADPTAPTDLTATCGQKLSDVALPTGWTWADSTQSVGSVVSPAATFKANFAGDDNYNAASNVDVTVTVSKADATTAMQAASVSIAGTSGKTATVSYALPNGASYGAVTNSNTEFFTVDTTSGIVLTAAKNWTASDWATDTSKTFTVLVSGATNYNDYTLTVTVTPTYKATQTITAADVTATYGDTNAKIEATTTSGGGTLSYAVKSGEAVTVNENTGALTIVKAGSAVITVTAAETATYAQATKDVNVTINAKTMTVSAEDVNVTVDGQPHGITVTVTDPASGATVKYGTEVGTYNLDASPTQTAVGEKTVYYQVTADNYTTYTGSAKVTVSAKQTQTITADDVTATYGDTDKKVTATTNGNGAISYAVKDGSADYIDVDTSTGALTIKKVGTATVIVTAEETSTYAQATKEVTVTINKANAVPATVTANNRTYDGTEKSLVTVTGEPMGGTMYYALGENSTTVPANNLYTTSIPAKTEAGTYYVWYKVVGDANHSDSAPVCVTVTIAALTEPVITGYALELGGVLGLRYYMLVPDGFDATGAAMTFAMNNRENQVIPYSEIKADNQGKYFTCIVYAYQMADTITATFTYKKDGETQILTDTYSVKQYLDSLEGGEYADKALNLVNATRAYGHFIQPYLARVNGWTVGGKYAELDYPGAVNVNAALAGSEAKKFTLNSMDSAYVQAAQYRLLLNADTSFIVEVRLKNTPAGSVTMTVNESAVTPTVSGTAYRVEIGNIAANNLGVTHHVVMKIGSTTVFDFTASPLSYVYTVLSKSSPAADEQNALAALYEYWQAAAAYNSQN